MPVHVTRTPFAHLSAEGDWAGRPAHIIIGMQDGSPISTSSPSEPQHPNRAPIETHPDSHAFSNAHLGSSIEEADRPRAVVIDPDPNLLEILGELLGDEGYNVILASHGLDADTITQLNPDIVIADAAFRHDVERHAVIDDLSRADGTTFPVIYNTTELEIAARMTEQRLPVLLKPFDLDELLALMARADT